MAHTMEPARTASKDEATWTPSTRDRGIVDSMVHNRSTETPDVVDVTGSETLSETATAEQERKRKRYYGVVDLTESGVFSEMAPFESKGKGKGKRDVVDVEAAWEQYAQLSAIMNKAKGRIAMQCPICNERRTKGVECSEGHFVCKTCCVQYVSLTLEGTIFWDTIECVNYPCKSYYRGVEIREVMPQSAIQRIEKRQMDAAYLVAGERDPSSQTLIDKHSKPCPRCGIPIQKNGGCDHVKCTMCRKDFWWTCNCEYSGQHKTGCAAWRR